MKNLRTNKQTKINKANLKIIDVKIFNTLKTMPATTIKAQSLNNKFKSICIPPKYRLWFFWCIYNIFFLLINQVFDKLYNKGNYKNRKIKLINIKLHFYYNLEIILIKSIQYNIISIIEIIIINLK